MEETYTTILLTCVVLFVDASVECILWIIQITNGLFSCRIIYILFIFPLIFFIHNLLLYSFAVLQLSLY